MPFYEYECSSCKFYLEAMQKVSDPLLRKCPSCRKDTLKKLISAPVFRLKGGGWYETDFKSEGENKRNLAGADKEEPKPETKSEAKTETAPKEVEKPKTSTSETKKSAAKPSKVKKKKSARR